MHIHRTGAPHKDAETVHCEHRAQLEVELDGLRIADNETIKRINKK